MNNEGVMDIWQSYTSISIFFRTFLNIFENSGPVCLASYPMETFIFLFSSSDFLPYFFVIQFPKAFPINSTSFFVRFTFLPSNSETIPLISVPLTKCFKSITFPPNSFFIF